MRLIAAQSINAIIDSLQAQVNSEIRNKQQLDNLRSLVSIQALQDLTGRLANIRSILNIQRYNLVFIGQVGAGKREHPNSAIGTIVRSK